MVTSPAAHADHEEEEDLSEEQMDALLEAAEARLRQNDSAPRSSGTSYKIPKLQSSGSDTPYVTTEGHVARVDRSKMVDAKTQSAANAGVRKVEDPLVVKRRAEEVCLLCSHLLYPSVYEENFPFKLLTRKLVSVLDSLLHL
jgi:hypothetical protein